MLCDKCKLKATLPATGRCNECGSGTSSVLYKLCTKCSRDKQECQLCRTPIVPDPFADLFGDGNN